MPSHAQFVVIGGGIIGCSTAYHLARDHKADVILLEQNKLTSGSTWHAAGLVGQLRSSASITQVLKYSVDLYKKLDTETGLATGWKMTGCLRLATNAGPLDRIQAPRHHGAELRHGDASCLARRSEEDVAADGCVRSGRRLVAADRWPGLAIRHHAVAGQGRPHAWREDLRRLHRVKGFDIVEGRVKAVRTNLGTIACETVINCGGQWARQIGAMAGVSVPLQPVKHQYIITEKIEGLAPMPRRSAIPTAAPISRKKSADWCSAAMSRIPIAWTTGDVPGNFEFQLFEDDWDHFEQHMGQALARVPALENTGIKKMINGPESFTPDGNFILGAAPECKNFYVGAGFNAFGIASGGGAGWVLAEWAAKGEAPMDLWVVDIRRFSDLHKDRDWTCERTLEAYGKHYTVGFPHEEYQSGRPRIVSPLYERLKSLNACFGSKLGWERPNWFAPTGTEPKDIYSMGRQNWFDAVGERTPGGARERRACSTSPPSPNIELDGHGRGRGARLDLRQPRAVRSGSSPIRRCSTRAAASSATSPWRGLRRTISTSSPAPASAPMTSPGSTITSSRASMRR